jgi:uncharacterized protein YuzE
MKREILTVKTRSAPIVEIDTEAGAAYVRFKKAKIARTVSREGPGPIIAVDLDSANEVIGVELIGVNEFSLSALLRQSTIRAPHVNAARTRYIRADNLKEQLPLNPAAVK